MNSLFSAYCIGENKGTDCTLLMHSIFFALCVRCNAKGRYVSLCDCEREGDCKERKCIPTIRAQFKVYYLCQRQCCLKMSFLLLYRLDKNSFFSFSFSDFGFAFG